MGLLIDFHIKFAFIEVSLQIKCLALSNLSIDDIALSALGERLQRIVVQSSLYPYGEEK